MSKERMFRFSLLACLMIVFSFSIGSCLNPINFDETSLPRIPVDVSGSIDVSIKDVAVFWLINRTKNVDVLDFKIDREKIAPDEADYGYPMSTSGMPEAGTSLASYHTPTEKMYQITVLYKNRESSDPAVIGPLNVQFPRAQDYRYYLYWTQNGELVLVNEDKMQDLPPDPNANWPDPHPSSVNAHTLVIMNATPDQNLDSIQFEKNGGGSIYLLQNRPHAKDQARILLGTGDYNTTAFYTRNGPKQTASKTTIITAETGSMAVRTNYLYYYKTKDGGYSLSPVWPPIPNDASDENKPEDALDETQGILEITNNANPGLPNDIIDRVNISGYEHPNTTNNAAYMVPGDVRRYILPVGTAYVSFKPHNQTFYGQTIPRDIAAKAVTYLSYTNNMGNPDFIPEDTPNGAGLVRITNNTTGVVGSVTVYDRSDLSKYISVPYEEFTPPYPIQYGKVGRVLVSGTDECPLRAGVSQIIQVLLETTNGMVVVERVAALRGQLVDIVIEEGSLSPSSRTGSKVTVTNSTTYPTNILGMYVSNVNDAGSSAVYYLDIPNPGSKSVYVLSSTGLPIVQGETYKATLSVYGNGRIALIDKTFSPDGRLFSTNPDSNLRTITLTDVDLPPELKEVFKPVTGLTTTPSPYTVNVHYTTDMDGVSNPQVIYSPDFNLNGVVTVQPDDATTKGPIEWSRQLGGAGQVTVSSDGRFVVNGFVPEGGERTVRVQGVIRNAAGTVTNKSDYTGSVDIILNYLRTGTTTTWVTRFTLTYDIVKIKEGSKLDLETLVASIDPTGANVNGIPVTADDLTWSLVVPNDHGSSISGSELTAGTEGIITVRATMPNSKTNSGDKTATKQIEIIKDTPTFVPIGSIEMQSGFSGRLNYYTMKGTGAEYLYASDTLALGVKFNPATATIKSPLIWSFVSGGSPVVLGSNPDQLTVITGTNIPTVNSVQVQVRVPGGLGSSSDYISPSFTINLVKHSSRIIMPDELTLKTGTIKVHETISLNTLVNPFPSGTGYDYIPSVNDLVWSIVSGPGTLTNGIVTGNAQGTITVRAVLPAAKNPDSRAGSELVKETTITVEPLPPSHPNQLTLRVFKMDEDNGSSDTIVGIYAAMATYPDSYLTNLTEGIKSSGHTGLTWANESKNVTYHSNFKTYYLDKYYSGYYRYFDKLNIKDGGYADITIPWPTGSATGYNLFFNEGDSRVRGYVTPYQLDPPEKNNFVFYLDFQYVYTNFLLPMNGYTQVAKGTSGAMEVIPIYYNSYRNVGAIMKARGVGSAPLADYTGVVKK